MMYALSRQGEVPMPHDSIHDILNNGGLVTGVVGVVLGVISLAREWLRERRETRKADESQERRLERREREDTARVRTAEIDISKVVAEQISAITAQMLERIKKLEDDEAKLRAEFEENEASLRAEFAMREQNLRDHFEGEIKALQEENDECRRRNDEQGRRIAALEAEKARLTQQNEALHHEMDELRRALDSHRATPMRGIYVGPRKAGG